MNERRVLVVDNRDSFVFNLVEDLERLRAACRVVRGNIELKTFEDQLRDFAPDLVLLSPGPGRPEDAGVMVPWLASHPTVPVFGVCLGLQAMVHAVGGDVGRAPRPVHGRATEMVHEGDPLFAGIPSPFRAARYHSLVATRLTEDLRGIAWTSDPETSLVMAVRHRSLPWVGVQFHPESILTPQGARIVGNLLSIEP